MLIYRCTNIATGKAYIGKTTRSLGERMHRHECDYQNPRYSSVLLYRSMKKHGFDAFTWEILCTADTRKELAQLEKAHIQRLNTIVPNGYNLTGGGDGGGTFGRVVSQEQRDRISRSETGKTVSRETRQKQSSLATGRKRSANARLSCAKGQQRRRSKEMKTKIPIVLAEYRNGSSIRKIHRITKVCRKKIRNIIKDLCHAKTKLENVK